MANPTEILDQLRHIQPDDIEAGIQFCRTNIEQIKTRRQAEIETEKAEIAKLRRLARVLGLKSPSKNGHAKPPKRGSTRETLCDRIADVIKVKGPMTTADLAESLDLDQHAVQCAIGRGGKRFVRDGKKVSLA